MTADDVKARAKVWADEIGEPASIVQSQSTIGGGSLPGETLPTWALAIECESIDGGAQAVAKRLRDADTPVMGRIEDERVLLDARAVLPEEEKALLDAVRHVVAR